MSIGAAARHTANAPALPATGGARRGASSPTPAVSIVAGEGGPAYPALFVARGRLRIQVPRKVPVCHNGTPTVGYDLEEGFGGETHGPKTVHHVTCHKEDRITICNNIIIAALDFRRFVFSEHSPCLSER